MGFFGIGKGAKKSSGAMDTLESGTKKYMSLYPEKSTDGGKRVEVTCN